MDDAHRKIYPALSGLLLNYSREHFFVARRNDHLQEVFRPFMDGNRINYNLLIAMGYAHLQELFRPFRAALNKSLLVN